MNSRLFTAILVLFCVLAAPGSHAASPPTKEEIAAAAAWFDSLEWPDVRGKPYVEIAFGTGFAGSKRMDGPKIRGFLLAEDDQAFTILADGTVCHHEDAWPFSVRRIKKPDPSSSGFRIFQKRPVELSTAVAELIADLHRPPNERQLTRGYLQRTSPRASVFFLARCCSRQGRADLAELLDAELPGLAGDRSFSDGSAAAVFRTAIEQDIAHALMWEAVVDCGDLSYTRPALLARFERIVRDFPASQHQESAKKYVTRLRTLVAEDEEHAGTVKPLEQMSESEKIHEWIFRLRDQNGHQFGQPGGVEIFDHLGLPGEGSSPADQLVRFGYAAVPALIEALDDSRPTRSVGYGRDFFFSHYVLTVGDCAADILVRIGGQDYWNSRRQAGALSRLTSPDANRAAAQQWWAEVQRNGEEATLIAGVSVGDADSESFARQLLAINPEAAFASLLTAIRSGKEHWMRPRLINLLAEIKTHAATEALRVEMKQCDSVLGRAGAATALLRRGEKDAVPAMIEELKNWPPAPSAGPEYWRKDPWVLFSFLATCGDPGALRALAARFASLAPEFKTQVLDAVAGTRGNADPKGTPVSAECEGLREELIVTALADRTPLYGYARVCDRAASLLGQRWPDRYASRQVVTRLDRDTEIVRWQNVWRAAHGLSLSPLPERPPLLAADQDPNTVAVCRWIGGPPLAGVPISIGSPLTAEAFVETLTRLYQDCPAGSAGINVHAERPGDRRGFLVEIEWVPGLRPGLQREWRYRAEITIGGVTLCDVSDRSPQEKRIDPTSYRQEALALSKALADDPGEAIVIHLHSTDGPSSPPPPVPAR